MNRRCRKSCLWTLYRNCNDQFMGNTWGLCPQFLSFGYSPYEIVHRCKQWLKYWWSILCNIFNRVLQLVLWLLLWHILKLHCIKSPIRHWTNVSKAKSLTFFSGFSVIIMIHHFRSLSKNHNLLRTEEESAWNKVDLYTSSHHVSIY